ncbi:MAG: AAA family ATPase [Bacilli bacterium]|nr:AAA family ATPase [Bacilli bacterium]
MNEGILTIFNVWDKQQLGYVALPRKKGDLWEEKNFKYPQDKQLILKWIKESIIKKYNIYWCPTVLNKSRRIADNIPQINVLYADLDEIDPEGLPNDLKPSIAWQTSDNRYAAIWSLDKFIDSKVGEKLNKRLTYYIGADRGGWDLTQVLRIPGLPNYKYSPVQLGKLLWNEDKVYSPKHFVQLPKVEELSNTIDTDIKLLDTAVNDIIYKYIDKLNIKAVKLLLTPQEQLNEADRSMSLWELECILFEAGMTKDEVYTIAKNSIWNKYRDRKDENKRLISEIEKAYSHTTEPVVNLIRSRKIITYSELMGKNIEQPKWLIKDWWEAGSHGIIAGEPKTYKSTITTEIAVSVASGKPLFNNYEVVTPGPVIIIQEENSEWLMQDRFAKISGSKDLMGSIQHEDKVIKISSPEDLPILCVNREGINLTQEEDKQWIESLCKQNRPVLIILDPLYLMLGEVDSNSAKELRNTLQWLITLSTKFNIAVMLVHHFNKGGTSSRGGQRMLGSTTLHAWVQSAIYNRVADNKKNTITVEREFRSFNTPEDLQITFNLGEPGELSYKTKIDEKGSELKDIIITLLATAPQDIKDLAGHLSLPASKIKEVLLPLQRTGKIVYDKGKYKIKGSD